MVETVDFWNLEVLDLCTHTTTLNYTALHYTHLGTLEAAHSNKYHDQRSLRMNPGLVTNCTQHKNDDVLSDLLGA